MTTKQDREVLQQVATTLASWDGSLDQAEYFLTLIEGQLGEYPMMVVDDEESQERLFSIIRIYEQMITTLKTKKEKVKQEMQKVQQSNTAAKLYFRPEQTASFIDIQL
ncbi:hypothetical protein [Enterococcus bulliens]